MCLAGFGKDGCFGFWQLQFKLVQVVEFGQQNMGDLAGVPSVFLDSLGTWDSGRNGNGSETHNPGSIFAGSRLDSSRREVEVQRVSFKQHLEKAKTGVPQQLGIAVTTSGFGQNVH